MEDALALAPPAKSPFDRLGATSLTVAVNALSLVATLAHGAKVPPPPGVDSWREWREALQGLPAGEIPARYASETAKTPAAVTCKVRSRIQCCGPRYSIAVFMGLTRRRGHKLGLAVILLVHLDNSVYPAEQQTK